LAVHAHFVGVFAELWKVTVSFIVSAHPYGMDPLALDGFSWSFVVVGYFIMSVKEPKIG
jgi:hypothetical protein